MFPSGEAHWAFVFTREISEPCVCLLIEHGRLDRECVDLQGELERKQESVMVLVDKKEVLEATRHATLVKCLDEVNDAFGGIYRRLTSVEGVCL